MPTYPFMQIDAFTDTKLSGNPCAVIFDCANMGDSTLQAISLEMNLSETAFISNISDDVINVRYFTPAEEIPFAGHPTLATAYAAIISGNVTLSGAITQLKIMTRVGKIIVDVHSHAGTITEIVMSQPKPEFMSLHDPDEVMPVFGLQTTDILDGHPIQTVSTGTPQLMVPVCNHEKLAQARLQVGAYSQLKQKSDFFSPHLFCLGGATTEGDTFARHFGVPPDTMEDPFTGSATGGMAAYLWQYGLIDKPTFIAQQGHWMNRPGQAKVEVIGARDDIEKIKVGGFAVTVLTGELIL